MNINIGLKSVAAKAATATMVPTPLQDVFGSRILIPKAILKCW